jgi:hypothetical protein
MINFERLGSAWSWPILMSYGRPFCSIVPQPSTLPRAHEDTRTQNSLCLAMSHCFGCMVVWGAAQDGRLAWPPQPVTGIALLYFCFRSLFDDVDRYRRGMMGRQKIMNSKGKSGIRLRGRGSHAEAGAGRPTAVLEPPTRK